MTFVDNPWPKGLELLKLQDKRHANLTHEGRIPGSINKISKDLKQGLIEGATAYGYDGNGEGGLHGYLAMCAAKFPKAYLQVLAKLVPIQINGDAPTNGAVINVIGVPSGHYVIDDEVVTSPPPVTIEHIPEPPRLTPLEEKLLAMDHAQLLELARALNVGT